LEEFFVCRLRLRCPLAVAVVIGGFCEIILTVRSGKVGR
jgi:hypothetical protein